MKLDINDTFAKELPADQDETISRRQVLGACYSYVSPRMPANPELVHYSDELAKELGLENDTSSAAFLGLVSGRTVYPGTSPFAMCYGGHQFGNWAGQLGDGRAINLFEMEHGGNSWAVQLKGAGETPYSRTADGLAVLRSSVREHLCSEAMHHLGVPTTRSLALVLSGDQVLRDILYDGNPEYEKGAIVTRVAPSFIRFGNFQILASRNDVTNLKLLADYTIRHFFTGISSAGKEKYLEFYQEVAGKTLEMVLDWQRVGFVHGVMNTDNMSILGLTIDYGPYGWMEDFNPDWTPNTTDAHKRRYRFANQPHIALWNLVQLGNALYPLIQDVPAMEKILDDCNSRFDTRYHQMMQAKLGLVGNYDDTLHDELQTVLKASETDMTIFYRNLSNVSKSDLAADALEKVRDAFYKPEEIRGKIKAGWIRWFTIYLEKVGREPISDKVRKTRMNLTNPKYVLRNYMAQLAIDAAENGDYAVMEEFYALLKNPYGEQAENEKWFAKRPEWARHKVGCSMLSCSS